jgi:hypothetical protein
MRTPHPPIQPRLRGAIDGATERMALRAVLSAARLLGVATGTQKSTHPTTVALSSAKALQGWPSDYRRALGTPIGRTPEAESM